MPYPPVHTGGERHPSREPSLEVAVCIDVTFFYPPVFYY